jgi:hypothetical protein
VRVPGLLANKKTSRILKEGHGDSVHMDIDSGDESDGRNALREVEAREEPRAARRGPGNASTVCNIFMSLQPSWTGLGRNAGSSGAVSALGMSTQYRASSDAYIELNSTRSFPRTVNGEDVTFDMEPKLPRLQNLAGHVTECKGAKDNKDSDEPTSEEQVNLKQSAEIMEAYLKEGELNPEVVVTYKGFLRLFSAWILDESLPWTAGEAPTL